MAYIKSDDFSPQLDKDVLSAWVDEATSGMNTVGTERTWTREDGKVCTVSGGTYGWQVEHLFIGRYGLQYHVSRWCRDN